MAEKLVKKLQEITQSNSTSLMELESKFEEMYPERGAIIIALRDFIYIEDENEKVFSEEKILEML